MEKNQKKFLKIMISFVMTFCMIISLIPTNVFADGVKSENNETYKVIFDNSKTNWQKVRIHYWGGSNESSYPGVDAEKVEGEENCYYYNIPKDTTSIMFIGEDTSKKTVDIPVKGDARYIGWGTLNNKVTVARLGDDGQWIDPDTEEVEQITLNYDNSVTKWDEVYVYHYGGPAGAAWPGKKMTLVEGSQNLYTVQVPKGIETMIFNNNNDQQTVDIINIEDGGEYVAIEKAGSKYAVGLKNPDGSLPGEPGFDGDEAKKEPTMVNIHIGEGDYSVNINFANLAPIDSKVVVNKVGSNDKITFEGNRVYSFIVEKYLYSIKVTALEPATKYEYIVGEGDYTYSGTFTTAPELGSKETIKFAFIADPQVKKGSDAKAAGSVFNALNKYDDLGFVYIAGDMTDNSVSESQWESLFNNEGLYPDAGQTLFGNNIMCVCQGNHDVGNFTGHITAPSEAGDVVYSFDYGPLRVIILNTEVSSAEGLEEQREFLEKEMKQAKEEGLWTAVGFHRAIYSGASHIVDEDIVHLRKYWAPILSDLDVDLVLQGHDHVYTRGFITKEGTNANLTANEDGSYTNTENVPLYFTGGHAGGYKWYEPINYSVSEGDPIASNYEFLDVNSAADGKQGEQSYTIVEVSNDEIKFDTYMYQYDTTLDIITKEEYLYDTVTVKRELYNIQIEDIEGATVIAEGSYEVSEDNTYKVANGSNFSFKVELDNEYSDSNINVKVNDKEIIGVDGIYTIENVNENITINIDGVVKKESTTDGDDDGSDTSTEDDNTLTGDKDNSNEDNKENNNSTNDGKLVNTGDGSSIIWIAILLFASLAEVALLVWSKKRKVN